MEDNPDYVTLLTKQDSRLLIVALMRYDKGQDGYTAAWCSKPMPRHSAQLMARSTATGLHLEVQ